MMMGDIAIFPPTVTKVTSPVVVPTVKAKAKVVKSRHRHKKTK
jgi:hypothetical protein